MCANQKQDLECVIITIKAQKTYDEQTAVVKIW